jgi:hypothetical protein
MDWSQSVSEQGPVDRSLRINRCFAKIFVSIFMIHKNKTYLFYRYQRNASLAQM